MIDSIDDSIGASDLLLVFDTNDIEKWKFGHITLDAEVTIFNHLRSNWLPRSVNY